MPWVPSAQTSPASNDRGSFQGRSGDSSSSFDQGRGEQQHKVYIQNIPMDMQQERFESLFGQCGQVVSSKLLEPKGGRNTVAGFVTFSTEEAVEEAIQKMSGFTLSNGPPLRVMRPANKSNNNNQSSGTCHKCGEAGHYANRCPSSNAGENRQGGSCYKCGEAGHYANRCPSSSPGDNRQGGKTCHKCGEVGHFSRECPNSSGDNRPFNDNSQQQNNRFHNGPSQERSPFGNDSRNNAPNPNTNQSSGTNFMAMLGRGETRNTSIPRPGQSTSYPPLKPLNTTQPMQNGYQDKPGNQGYQSQSGSYPQEEKHQTMSQGYQQPSAQGNYQQPPEQAGYQEPQRFQQPADPGNQGYQQPSGNYQEQQGYQQPGQGNYHHQPGPGSYQEPQQFQQPSDPGNQGYQQPNTSGDPQTFQQTPVPGSYQEQQTYQQPSSEGYQLPGSGNYQEQAPPQDYQYQQPQGSPGYQGNYYQEAQPPAQQPAHYNQPETQQAQTQPSYNQPSSGQSAFSPPDSGQANQSTSSNHGRSWGDAMASREMNGGATTQEQSSWQQRSQNNRSSGDNVCHNCKEPGHFSRECPNPRQSGGQTCHKCGETGHFARECPNNTGSQSCHKCGEVGHFSRECPNKSGPGDNQLCHRCGGAGHFARDCSQEPNSRGGSACFKCGQEGHMSRDCPQSAARGGSGCHRCGEEGHFARECPNMAADPSRPAPVTYIPEEIDDMDTLFKDAPHFGINFERYDNIPVKVSGDNEPNPINSFEEVNFGSQCKANIKRAGYVKPTPVQKHTFPIVLGGRDLMACAQTGSGKTVAYLLPTLTNMINKGLPIASRSPLVLVLAPTRELVRQIYQEAKKFSDGTPIRVNEVYGGVSVQYQSQCLEQGCHFLVATPGRLLDFISRERIYLDNIQYLILDEADRMLDMGFEQDVRKIVQQSNMTDRYQRQTLMFSATFPDEVQLLAADFLKTDYLFLAVGRVGGTNLDIEQRVLQVNGNDKRDRLFDILNTSGLERTLVFVELKRVADFLACLLSENNFPTTSISSDRSQREREEALRDFRNGRAKVLVATSVAARGLDIPDVKHVVNYDLPQEIDEYVHRIGRTGRIGNQGKATSFFEQGRDEKIARSLVKVLSEAYQEVPAWLEQFAEDAVGSGYGPKGGRFSSRDTREGGRGRQNGHQNVILQNDPNSQFGSQAPAYSMQNGPSQASYSYNGDGRGSAASYSTGGGTGDSYNTDGGNTGPSYNTGGGGNTGPSYNTGGGSGPSYNTSGGGTGPSYKTSVGGAGQVYNIGGGEAGNSDDDWD